MTAKPKTALKIVEADLSQMEAVVIEAAQQSAPMVNRVGSAENDVKLRLNILVRERDDFMDRQTLLRRQFEAADAGLAAQIEDIEATMRLYEGGLNSLTAGV